MPAVTHAFYAIARGGRRFPVDLLRQECIPATPLDSTKLTAAIASDPLPGLKILLTCYVIGGHPLIHFWNDAGWDICRAGQTPKERKP